MVLSPTSPSLHLPRGKSPGRPKPEEQKEVDLAGGRDLERGGQLQPGISSFQGGYFKRNAILSVSSLSVGKRGRWKCKSKGAAQVQCPSESAAEREDMSRAVEEGKAEGSGPKVSKGGGESGASYGGVGKSVNGLTMITSPLNVMTNVNKSTLCLYHLTFLTFMLVTLLFLIITIGASENETEDGVSAMSLEQQQPQSNLTLLLGVVNRTSVSQGATDSPLRNSSTTHNSPHYSINQSASSKSASTAGSSSSGPSGVSGSSSSSSYTTTNSNHMSEDRVNLPHQSGTAQLIIHNPSSTHDHENAQTQNLTAKSKLIFNLDSYNFAQNSIYTHQHSFSQKSVRNVTTPPHKLVLDEYPRLQNVQHTQNTHNTQTRTSNSNEPDISNSFLQLSESALSNVSVPLELGLERSAQQSTLQDTATVHTDFQSDQSPEEEDWTTRILRSFGFHSGQESSSSSTSPSLSSFSSSWMSSWWSGESQNQSQTRTGQKETKQRGSRSVCRISEFSCNRGKCVPGDKFCDGVDDCGDSSDEPRFCTPCNRTYYGEWGSTYSLSLSSETISSILQSHHGGKSTLQGTTTSASRDKKPATSPHFVCQLAFAAAGDNFGDLVQIMFDSISIGQFSSSMVQGCPSGSLQIFEINRPITGGHWCGSGSGYSVYFSEMSAIVLTLSLGAGATTMSSSSPSGGGGSNGTGWSNNTRSKSSNETVHNFSKWTTKGGDTTVITSSQQPTNHFEFDFKIRYKFIPKSLAVVRYGLVNSPIERGVLVPDTYCSRVLDTCHKTRCKIQSPNYPGLYPRNVSCYYTVRQREIPSCKRVLIQVTQMKPHKVQLRSIPGRQLPSSAGAYNLEQSTNADAFLAWEDCRGERDSLIIYDGTTTNDPILLKLCGGTYIPPITSSGPAILVAFHSTAFGNPLDPKPAAPFPSPLRGFELDVGVVIVDSESADYNNHHNCSFIFISSKNGEISEFQAQEYGGNWITGKSGTVSSPRHTVPLNTTCRYEFRGSKHEAIWVYFVAYRRDLIKDSKEYEGNCTTRLRIWDGIDTRNNALLATYCDNELPRLCDHKALQNETRLVRACTANESYISAGSRLIIEQQFMEGTALRPLHYQFNYEFVRRHGGTDGTCNRHYNLAKMKSHRGIIRTSDNVFDFGRGGKTNLTCTYTFTLPSYESLHIKILNSSFGERPCKTLTDFETGRYVCNESMSQHFRDAHGRLVSSSASVRLNEEIWTNLNVTLHENCLCGNSSNNPMYFFTFLGRKVHVTFTIENMRSQDSPENFFVYFEYEVKPGGCRGDNHYMRTESGMISLESSFSHGLKEKPPTCDHYPWVIEAREGYSLYLRVPGFTMIEPGQQGRNGTYPFNPPATPSFLHNSSAPDLHPAIYQQQPSTISTSFENRLCPTTKNRIFIYDRNNKLVQKICPASNIQQMTKKAGHTVEIYSEDFDQFKSPLYPPLPPKFIIEFIGRELGSYRLQWLEVMSTKMKIALINMEKGGGTGKVMTLGLDGGGDSYLLYHKYNYTYPAAADSQKTLYDHPEILVPSEAQDQRDHQKTIQEQVCSSFCPELNACISDKLWCDGEVHCPMTLSDEKSCDSFWLTLSQLMSPAVYVPVAAALVSALVCCGFVMLCLFLKRTVLNGHAAKENGDGIRIGSLDRRLERMDPHDPIS